MKNFYFCISLFLVALFVMGCSNTTTPDITTPDTTTPGATFFYEQDKGDSWHNVGQDNWVNTYRGAYWIGESITVNKVDFHLNYEGVIAGISYKVSIWEVDPSKQLELITCLGSSESVEGSSIQADSWVSFNFTSPVSVVSGKTVILVSRVDTDNANTGNFLRINNYYDPDDLENKQMNVHYAGTSLAGRGFASSSKPDGDEDQPEPFAVDIRLYGTSDASQKAHEISAPPMRLVQQGTNPITLTWKNFNTVSKVTSYNVYGYTPTDASLHLIKTVTGLTCTLTSSEIGTASQFVLTAVGENNLESFYSDRARSTLAETVR